MTVNEQQAAERSQSNAPDKTRVRSSKQNCIAFVNLQQADQKGLRKTFGLHKLRGNAGLVIQQLQQAETAATGTSHCHQQQQNE